MSGGRPAAAASLTLELPRQGGVFGEGPPAASPSVLVLWWRATPTPIVKSWTKPLRGSGLAA